MAMQGSLREMSIADIIQHNCQDRKVAELTVENRGNVAKIYFRDGSIAHAVMGPLVGEEVVYHVLAWSDGTFTLEQNIATAETTVKRHWTNLLLEGAKRIDEYRSDSGGRIFGGDSPERRKDIILSELNHLLDASTEFNGVAVVGLDGGLNIFRFRENVDEKLVGAIATSCLSFGKRSLGLINKGNFLKTVIQGEQGNIVVASINPHALFIGFSSVNLDLQEVLSATSKICAKLSDILPAGGTK